MGDGLHIKHAFSNMNRISHSVILGAFQLECRNCNKGYLRAPPNGIIPMPPKGYRGRLFGGLRPSIFPAGAPISLPGRNGPYSKLRSRNCYRRHWTRGRIVRMAALQNTHSRNSRAPIYFLNASAHAGAKLVLPQAQKYWGYNATSPRSNNLYTG